MSEGQTMSDGALPTIAIIGGTGDLGSGLARTWSKAGYAVCLGSRSSGKAQEAAAALVSEGFSGITGAGNADAAAACDVAVIAVPFSNYEATLAEIRDAVRTKIVVTAVVPLVPPKVSTVQLPPAGSAALIARDALHPETKVVAAFHNVGSQKLHAGSKAECDVLVFSDDADARNTVI